jgi:hypothetical protein
LRRLRREVTPSNCMSQDNAGLKSSLLSYLREHPIDTRSLRYLVARARDWRSMMPAKYRERATPRPAGYAADSYIVRLRARETMWECFQAMAGAFCCPTSGFPTPRIRLWPSPNQIIDLGTLAGGSWHLRSTIRDKLRGRRSAASNGKSLLAVSSLRSGTWHAS